MAKQSAELVCDAVAILSVVDVMDYNGHASIRAEGGGFWINSAASDRAAMTPDQVCRVDDQGQIIAGDRPPNEVALHAAIYAARSDVQAVVHGHPKWSTLYSLVGAEIPIVMPQGCLVADLPVYPESHSISTAERGAAVAGIMGSRPGALLAAHGAVMTGQTLQEAVALAVYTEQNAERAYLARALGPVPSIPVSEHADYRKVLAKPALYEKCWNYYFSKGSHSHVR